MTVCASAGISSNVPLRSIVYVTIGGDLSSSPDGVYGAGLHIFTSITTRTGCGPSFSAAMSFGSSRSFHPPLPPPLGLSDEPIDPPTLALAAGDREFLEVHLVPECWPPGGGHRGDAVPPWVTRTGIASPRRTFGRSWKRKGAGLL